MLKVFNTRAILGLADIGPNVGPLLNWAFVIFMGRRMEPISPLRMSFPSLSIRRRGGVSVMVLELMESAKSKAAAMKDKQSRKRKRAKQRKHDMQSNDTTMKSNGLHKIHDSELRTSTTSKVPKSSTFLDKMRARLSGGHFRMINEKLYTCTGEEALNYFQEDPALFDMYHAGYKEQMAHWPEQPINIIINWLRDHGPSLTVADFGCGDARLAKSVKNKVFSFDLVSNDPLVIACDMSKTPLESSSVDVAVFCLSLMGTNYQSYLQEAHRVLKPCGWLLIAEVKSRFDPNTGGADPHKFSKAVSNLGFTSMLKDVTNKMFILLYFKKKDNLEAKRKESEWPELKPCLYKRR